MVNGKPMKIVLVKGDDESTGEAGVKTVTRLITEDKVDVLVGGFSSAVTYANEVVAGEHKVPYIITGASSPVITHRTDIDTTYFFHHCPTTDDYGESTMLFVNEIVGPAIYSKFSLPDDRKLRIALLYQDSKYGQGVYDAVKNTIAKYELNMEIVAAEKFKMGETDYRSVLTTIKAAKPDIVYPAAFLNEQTPIVVQGRKDVGLNSIYLSIECNDDPDYYKGVEKWGEYSIQESRFGPYAIPSGPIKEAVLKYRENYQKKWGSAPSMMGASTYEGIYIAAEAVKEAGTTDKAAVRDSLAEIVMPQMIEVMQDGTIKFSTDFRESKFDLYMQQLVWDASVSQTRPKIVWPADVKEAEFVLPDWYQPGA
jgi:branched-chain amino acid transport system substrate-binding protein